MQIRALKTKGVIKMNLEIKDALYYSDLIHKVKVLAGFEQVKDEIAEERIIEREKDIVEEKETGPLYKLSIFEEELFGIVRDISQKAGRTFFSLVEISKYPELVNDVLANLEKKKRELDKTEVLENGGPILKRNLMSHKNTENK